jgi:hypothetical protein
MSCCSCRCCLCSDLFFSCIIIKWQVDELLYMKCPYNWSCVNLKKYTKSSRINLRKSSYVIEFLYSQNHKTCCHPRKRLLEVEKTYPVYRENDSRMCCVPVMSLMQLKQLNSPHYTLTLRSHFMSCIETKLIVMLLLLPVVASMSSWYLSAGRGSYLLLWNLKVGQRNKKNATHW